MLAISWRGIALLVVACWPLQARAYRPFDQTDADVAEPKEFEIELGPVQLRHESGRSELVPGLVLNYGLTDRLEAVLEGDAGIRLGTLSTGGQRWALEPALLLKLVLREGSLQEKAGPSVAVEAGLLLPDAPAFTGTGASLAFIASQRWSAATVHVNVMVERSREATLDVVAGAIVEGPMRWNLRPVAEGWVAREAAQTTSSLLGGAIYRVCEALSVDGAIRIAPMPDRSAFEVRLGLTWAFSG